MKCPNCRANSTNTCYSAKFQGTSHTFACGAILVVPDDRDWGIRTIVPCPAKTSAPPFGYCPKCGAAGEQRERRLDGDDTCMRGHKYPSKDALDTLDKLDAAFAKTGHTVPEKKHDISDLVAEAAKMTKIRFDDDDGHLSMFKNGEWRKQACMQGSGEGYCGLHCPLCIMIEGKLHLCRQEYGVIDESSSNK